VKSEPEGSSVRYFRVARGDLVYLKFVLEAYEGMSTMSTVDQQSGIVRIISEWWAAEDICALIESLSREISLVEVEESAIA
jgi:hypothetical protein